MPLTGAPLSGDPSGSITFTSEKKVEVPSGSWVMSAPNTVDPWADAGTSARQRAASRSGAERGSEDRPWSIAGTVATACRQCNGGVKAPLARLADEALHSGLVDRALQPLPERDLRLPAEQVLGPGDVGLADLRVVDRERLEGDLGARAGHLDHGLGELQERVLVLAADVHRQVDVGLRQG